MRDEGPRMLDSEAANQGSVDVGRLSVNQLQMSSAEISQTMFHWQGSRQDSALRLQLHALHLQKLVGARGPWSYAQGSNSSVQILQ